MASIFTILPFFNILVAFFVPTIQGIFNSLLIMAAWQAMPPSSVIIPLTGLRWGINFIDVIGVTTILFFKFFKSVFLKINLTFPITTPLLTTLPIIESLLVASVIVFNFRIFFAFLPIIIWGLRPLIVKNAIVPFLCARTLLLIFLLPFNKLIISSGKA